MLITISFGMIVIICGITLIWSHLRNIRAVYAALFFIQIRVYLGMFSQNNVIDDENVRFKSTTTVIMFHIVIMNTFVYSLLARSKYTILVNLVNVCLIYLGVLYRFYDCKDFNISGAMIFNMTFLVICQIIFILLV
jgi:hypothetical protein